MKRKPKLITGLVIIFFVIIIGLIWYLRPHQPMKETKEVLGSNENIDIDSENYYVFKSADEKVNTGLIFYPGARVKPEAYAPLAYDIAKSNIKVVIVPMPLNLAILGVNRADNIIEEYDNITNWIIGGHSLGGAMAARYTNNNPQKILGLILLASYPSQSDDLSNEAVRVLSIYGNEDEVVSIDDINKSKEYLPDNAEYVEIDGGNHSQFGWYGFQDGDGEAEISRDKQQSLLVNYITEFIISLK